MKIIQFKERIKIKGNTTDVFDFTQNYDLRLSWDTFLTKAYLIDGADEAGIGVKAFCKAYNGMAMVTEYLSYNRPHVTAIQMTKGPFMFKSFIGSWKFKQLPDDYTEVLFVYSFSLRFPFSFLNRYVKRNLINNVKQRLGDLKTCIESHS